MMWRATAATVFGVPIAFVVAIAMVSHRGLRRPRAVAPCRILSMTASIVVGVCTMSWVVSTDLTISSTAGGACDLVRIPVKKQETDRETSLRSSKCEGSRESQILYKLTTTTVPKPLA
jgi:hypothetical protein